MLVRKLLAGKLPQKEMPELWQRHDVTQYMQREWDRCAKPAEDDLLRESRIWERIVARTMPHEKIRRRGGVRTAWLSRSYGAAASIMLAIGAGLTLVNLLWRPAPEIIHTLYSGNQSTEQVALPEPTPRAGTPRIFRAGNDGWSSTARGSSRWRKIPPDRSS